MDTTAIFEGGTSQHGCCDGATPLIVALSVEFEYDVKRAGVRLFGMQENENNLLSSDAWEGLRIMNRYEHHCCHNWCKASAAHGPMAF
jgi:hypothetical protein